MWAGARRRRHPKKRRRLAGVDTNGEASEAVLTTGVGEDGGGVDLISTIPDDILGEIIYLLPTKAGGRTSILAKWWRHLWRKAPLNLDCRHLCTANRGNLGDVLLEILEAHSGQGHVRRLCGPGALVRCPLDDLFTSRAFSSLQELALKLYYGRMPSHTAAFWATLSVLDLDGYTLVAGCNLDDETVARLDFPGRIAESRLNPKAN